MEIDESALQSASTPEDSEEDSETKREVKQKVVKNDPNANKKNRDEEEHDEHQVTAPTLDDLEKDPKDDDESKLNLELVREVVQDAQKTVQKVLQVVQDQLEDPKSSETTLKRIQVEDSLAPSLDHDDEAAFLAFLEDFENPPEKEREDELSTVPSDSIEIQEVKEESEDEDNVESATVPHERNPNNSAKDDQPKNADLIRPVGGKFHSGPAGLGQKIQQISFFIVSM